MAFIASFKEGFAFGVDSIKLVWRHKKLVWYLIIAGIVQAALSPLAPRENIETQVVQTDSGTEETVVVASESRCTTFGCISFVLVLSLIVSALTGFAALTCTIALARHALQIMRNDHQGTIKGNLLAALASWHTSAAWMGINWGLLGIASLISGGSFVSLLMFGTGWSTAFGVGVGMVGLVFAAFIIFWNIITLFVPVGIAAEKHSIVSIIKNSAHLVKHAIIFLFGGYCLGIVILLAIIPIVIAGALITQYVGTKVAIGLGILVAPIVLIALLVLGASYTVFLAMVYTRKKGNMGHNTMFSEPPHFRVP